jgi:ABC transporter DrrB family efflux protein
LPETAPARPFSRVLLALIAGQIGIHSTMAGVRLAAPLQALRDGHSALSVGLLLALYAAAPVLLSLHAGRLADRLGYHRPVRVAIGLALCGAALAVSSTFVADGFWLLCVSAVFVGSGANLGLIAVQRKAGLSARDNTERVRVFSWLGIAPSLSNVIGPVSAGFLIDAGGFRAAYALMLLLPLLSWWFVRYVPVEGLPRRSVGAAPRGSAAVNTVPGLVGMILTMTMVLFTSIALVRERERGNLEMLIATPVSPWELTIGKILPFVAIGLVQTTVVLLLGDVLFNVPLRGSLLELYVAALVFITANLSLGIFISTLTRTQFQAMQMSFFTFLPQILLSGFMFPFAGMPKAAQYVAEVMPLTHFLRLVRGIMLRGADLTELWPSLAALGAFITVMLAIAVSRVRKRLD